MAGVFLSLAEDRQLKKLLPGLVIKSARGYAPKRGDRDYKPRGERSDVPWIRKFVQDGGQVIISGDRNMKREPHERLALVELGLITIFFDPQWSDWKFFRQCALLMFWWPVVAATIRKAKPGSFWHIPCVWTPDGKLRQVSNEDLKLTRIKKQIADGPRKRAEEGRSEQRRISRNCRSHPETITSAKKKPDALREGEHRGQEPPGGGLGGRVSLDPRPPVAYGSNASLPHTGARERLPSFLSFNRSRS